MGQKAEAAQDHELVERAAAGEGEAFEALVMRYQDRVYGLALRLTRQPEEAEDVTQETFLKAYKALPEFGARSAFYTWLFRIAFNAAQTRLRSLGRLHVHERAVPIGAASADGDDPSEGIQPVSQNPGPAEAVETADTAARVQRAMDELDPGYRAVVLLREVEGLSYEEIAEVVGSTRTAVKSRLHRARLDLAGKLRDVLQ